jgi:hypothetical protein
VCSVLMLTNWVVLWYFDSCLVVLLLVVHGVVSLKSMDCFGDNFICCL